MGKRGTGREDHIGGRYCSFSRGETLKGGNIKIIKSGLGLFYFSFYFSFYFYLFFFHFLFLEQLGLGLISHTITSVTI